MKILSKLPKSVRTRMALSRLNKLRHSDFRKNALKERRSAVLLSNLLEQRADLLIQDAKNPGNGKLFDKYAGSMAAHDIRCSKDLDMRSKESASTKKKRQRIRKFFEVSKVNPKLK